MTKPLNFPTYRRSHIRSELYQSLVRIFSHIPAAPDNGGGRMELDNPEKGSESEFVGSTSVDPKDSVPEKITHEVHEITKGVGDKEGYESNLFIANTHQDGSNCRQVEPMTSDKNIFASAVEVEISQETVKFDNVGECDFVLRPEIGKNKEMESTGAISKALLEEDANQDQGNPSASKQKKRKNWAKKDRQLGVKRLKLPLVQKSKTIAYCRHYLVGRCQEGDKCKFSHDTVPLTKSTPCRHFARHSCKKGDDCPFDHELSKYPCNNFVTKGFCSRGDACLFSHQTTPSKVSRPELKSPPLLGNTSSLNSCSSSVQENHLISSMGIHSHVNSEHKGTGTIKQQLKPPPKGISFINFVKSSLPYHSTPEQCLITPNKESLVQIWASSDQSAFAINQVLVEIPKILPTVTHKGVNFLCFGKGSTCNFESSIIPYLSKENGIKVPLFVNFGLPNNASSPLKKDDYSKTISGTNQRLPRIGLVSEGTKLSFPRKAWIDDATTDSSQTSTATSTILLVSQFGLQRSSQYLPFRNHEHGSYSSQRGLLSTLAFAANE